MPTIMGIDSIRSSKRNWFSLQSSVTLCGMKSRQPSCWIRLCGGIPPALCLCGRPITTSSFGPSSLTTEPDAPYLQRKSPAQTSSPGARWPTTTSIAVYRAPRSSGRKELCMDVLSGEEDEELSDERFRFQFLAAAEARDRNDAITKGPARAPESTSRTQWWVPSTDLFSLGARDRTKLVRELAKRLGLTEDEELRLDQNCLSQLHSDEEDAQAKPSWTTRERPGEAGKICRY